MKNKFLLPILAFFATALFVGSTYSTWIYNGDRQTTNDIQVEVPE